MEFKLFSKLASLEGIDLAMLIGALVVLGLLIWAVMAYAKKAKAEAADASHQEQRQAAAKEAHRVAERMTKAEAERDTARADASKAREEAARLAGQLQAHQEQTAAILARLAPPAEAKPATTTTRKKADKGTPAE